MTVGWAYDQFRIPPLTYENTEAVSLETVQVGQVLFAQYDLLWYPYFYVEEIQEDSVLCTRGPHTRRQVVGPLILRNLRVEITEIPL